MKLSFFSGRKKKASHPRRNMKARLFPQEKEEGFSNLQKEQKGFWAPKKEKKI